MLEVLVLHGVVHDVNDLGSFLQQLSAGQILQLQFLNFSFGILLCFTDSRAEITIALATGVHDVHGGLVIEVAAHQSSAAVGAHSGVQCVSVQVGGNALAQVLASHRNSKIRSVVTASVRATSTIARE